MARSLLPDIFGRQGGSGEMFSSLQREIDQVFRDFGRGVPAMREFRQGMTALNVNVAETDKAIEVTAEVPGVDPKDIEVELRNGMLSIRGEKKVEKDEKEKDFHVVERSYGMFERSFTVPDEVDVNKVEASFDKGVLKVVMPKSAEAKSKTKKISITGG
jgi:HSP20 family protein